MKSRADKKMRSLRHFLFYMGLSCLGGAVVGAAAQIMDWSTGVVYAVGLPTALVIGLMSIRESLFAPAQPKQERHGQHA
jgi:hypothetical protein